METNGYARAITCTQATAAPAAATMVMSMGTIHAVMFFHDASKIGKWTLATVHFINSFSSG